MSSSLIVDTNLSALQALNDLNRTNASMSTAIERLSSGLKIQAAATGPAQYVVSQALTSQANGYTTAITNAQDGISLLQTASGALSKISSMLQKMDRLALTSANGATATTTSLAANEAEFKDLAASINEIATTTTFGTTKLLVGQVTSTHPTGTATTAYTGNLQVGAFDQADQQVTLSIAAVTTKALGLTGTTTTTTVQTTGPAVVTTTTLVLTPYGTVQITNPATVMVTVISPTGTPPIGSAFVFPMTYPPTLLVATLNAQLGTVATVSLVGTPYGTNLKLQFASTAVGATTAMFVSDFGTTAAALGFNPTNPYLFGTGTTTSTTTTVSATPASIANPTKAEAAVKAVQAAISNVDKVAATVGATQDKLNAIVANLTVGQQNLSAADSQLADVNMAQEMTSFSTDQILMQTGMAMLAQAQQAPSLVEKLI